MKIKLSITVEVDAEAWAEAYGIAKSDVRTDVRIYAVGQLQGSAAADEDLLTVVNPNG